MAGFLTNFGSVLRGVISQQPQEIREADKAGPVRETRTLSQTLDDSGDDSGGGRTGSGRTGGSPTGGGPTGGGGGGGPVVPPLSSTFILLVKLNFALIIFLLATVIGLAVWGDPDRQAIQTAFNTMITLFTGSVGTFVGLIGGKAA